MTSAAMKEVDILREIALRCKNKRLKNVSKFYYIVGIPLNYSLFSSSQCIASCETSLAFHWHPRKETKNLWGWSTKSFTGGGHNFMTSMRRTSQDNFHGKNSKKSVKYSQSYDFVCQMALLGGKGLRKKSIKTKTNTYRSKA